jgi:hydroxymethylpyrimidine/phosphomethylpyrimidine kinase
MTQDEIKALIEDLRLNHEFCPKEVILQAADELEKQRTWVELTDEERSKIWGELPQTSNEERDACIFAQAIEAKLKEKNR